MNRCARILLLMLFGAAMNRLAILILPSMALVAGCSTVATSNPIAPGARYDGPVFVSEAAVPAGINYKIIGSVQAEARVGYARVPELYPLLAEDAKKIGANAVVSAKGGHRVSAFSWAAP
jgi:hypothetical protein